MGEVLECSFAVLERLVASAYGWRPDMAWRPG